MRLLPALALLGCVRAEDCPATELCWDDEKFGVWDCDEEPAPIQVYKNDDDVDVVEKLDVATGTYENIFSLELEDVDKINAAAIYHHTNDEGDSEFFSFAAVQMDGDDEAPHLCRIDADEADHKECFDSPLQGNSNPNAGVILDDTYYYARNLGDGDDAGTFIYRVSGINGNAPDFHYDEDNLAFQGTGENTDLWKGQVLDLVAVKERATLIDDGEDSRSYLIGLGEGFEVVIVHLDDSGAPDKYAVVDSSVNWNGADEADRVAFGAAFAYDTADGESATLYFAGNDGEGLFQIGLPIAVDEDCWNSGDDPTDHAKCDSSSATLTRVADAAKAESNDGMNCPVVWTISETYAPTPEPIQCPDDEVCWTDMSVAAWDCAGFFSPVQVMKDGDDPYKAMTLDLETGEYEEMFELEFALDDEGDSQHVNAVGLLGSPVDDPTTYYAIGKFDKQLCRFDSESKVCWDTELEVKANAGAVGGVNYYYSSNLGQEDTRIHVVEGINSDTPTFHGSDTNKFAVSSSLFDDEILDYAYVSEADGTTRIDDDENKGLYLIGLSKDLKVFIAKIKDGLPEAYAVVPGTADWAGWAALQAGDEDEASDEEEEEEEEGEEEDGEEEEDSEEGEEEGDEAEGEEEDSEEDAGDAPTYQPTENPERRLAGTYGAAFAYEPSDGSMTKVYFASNEGTGLLQLELPLTIDDDCWNSGLDASEHTECDSTAQLTWISASDEADSNDGLNCPKGDIFETVAPSVTPSYKPTKAPTGPSTKEPTTAAPTTATPSYAPVPFPTPRPTPEQPAPTSVPTYAPQVMPTSPEPSPQPTLYMPSPAPNYGPSAKPTMLTCEPFDCSSHSEPIQILQRDKDEDMYSVCELNTVTGEYDVLYDIDWFDGHINAAGMFVGVDGSRYAYASFGGYLCAFDAHKKCCLDTPLAEPKPNAGTLVHTDYYYSKDPGGGTERGFHWVQNVTGTPIFHDDVLFKISASVYEGTVLDVATVDEFFVGEELIDDGVTNGRYLVGMAEGFEVLVVRCDETGYPAAYAVLPSVIDWSFGEVQDEGSFGAAYTFMSDKGIHVLFSDNKGHGLFEVGFPMTIPEECWNTGTDTSDHVACSNTVNVQWLLNTADASSNDGLNCPDSLQLFPPTLQPTSAQPTPDLYSPTQPPSIEPVGSVDCAAAGNPLQVMKYDDDDEYSVRMLDYATGKYEVLYSLDWFDGHINAVGMVYDSTKQAYYNVAGITEDGSSQLCRFGGNVERIECYGELAVTKPNAGAVLVDRYYYAKDPGNKDEKGIYWVDRVDTSSPTFHDDVKFVIRTDLYEDGVLDFAPLREELDDSGVGRTGLTVTSNFIDDGITGDYLIGLGEHLEVLVVYIDSEGYPSKYAVLPSTLDGNTDPSSQEIGAAWTYLTVESSGAYNAELLFSSNEDKGVFTTTLPITVPSACWNEGLDTSTHTFCDAATPVPLVTKYKGPGDDVKSNDGMNCPFVVNKDPTPSPVVAPKDPTPAPVATPATPAPVPAPTAAVPAPTATPSILVSSQLVIDDVPSDMDDDALTDIVSAALVDTLSGVREADDVLACDVTATTTVTTTAAPTAQVVEAAAEAASVISGSVAFAGLSQPDAEANKAVIEDGLARVAGVDADACSVTSISAARRRRLDDGAGVTVDYEIYVSLETAQDVAMALADAAADPTLVDTAIAEAAAAAGASSTFAACTTSSITSAVVAAVEDAYSFSFTYNVPYSYSYASPDLAGLECFNETLTAFSCYLDLYPDDDAAMFEALQDPTLMGDDDRWNSSGISDDLSLTEIGSCIDVQADAGFAEACGSQPQIVQEACGDKFDAQAECIFNSWTTAMGLDCDLDCAMTREFRKKRKLGVLDWARRLFSPSTTRPATTSPAVIRRRAQDAALDVLARPSPKTKRRLDVSPSKTKRAPFASLRHGRQRRYLQTEVSRTKTVSFTVRLWGVGHSGDTAASELATAAADGSLTTSLATASTNAGYDDGPACSGDANSLEALQAVTIAEGAPSAAPVIAPTPAPSAKPTWTLKPTLDAYEQCLEPACSCDAMLAACTGDDEDDDPDEYCDNGGSDLSSDIAGTTNHGSGVGWCMSTLDEKVGCTASPAECWATCEGAHGDRLVAIDWYADGSCWCQDSCPCMDFDLSPVVITRDDITLPNECTLCDYYEHALYGDCAGSDASDACQSDYYQAIECHYEAQLAELGETCPTQTCVEVLATPAPTPRPSTAAPVPAPTIPVTLAPTVKGSLDPLLAQASSNNNGGQNGFEDEVQSAGSPTMIALTCIGGIVVVGAAGVFLTRSREGAKEKARKARFDAINSESNQYATRYDAEEGDAAEDFGEADWAKIASKEDKVHIEDSATKPLYDDGAPNAPFPPPPPDEEAPMSPGDIDRFLGGDDDQWPEDEGKAQWPKEKMSTGDVDAFLGPDSPGNDSDSSDGAEAPPPPSSSASSVAPPLDADDAAEIAAMASSSDPFGAPANPFAAPAAPAVADDGATSPAADFAADAFGADPFGAPPEPTATAGAADAPAADPFAADPFGAPPPDPAVS